MKGPFEEIFSNEIWSIPQKQILDSCLKHFLAFASLCDIK
jgi:hypothetical protein